MVNGEKLTTPAHTVTSKDQIMIDGEPIKGPQPVRLWRYHKPTGLVTTHKDDKDRPTVFGALPKDLPRVISVGRLDYNTEGLLLLTTSGTLARHLELPATGWLRRYRVRAKGRITQDQLDKLKSGTTVDGITYGPIEAKLDDRLQKGANVWLTISLREGKNREVRKVLTTLDLTVNRLIRLSYGPFQLGDLPSGQLDEVPRHTLTDQLDAKTREALKLNEVGRTPTKPRSPAGPSAKKRRRPQTKRTASAEKPGTAKPVYGKPNSKAGPKRTKKET